MIILAIAAALILQQVPPTSTPPPQIAKGLQTQVILDRAGFSPGLIDGRIGPSTRRALELFLQQRGEQPPVAVPAVANYTITAEDVQGPFAPPIPEDMLEKAKLPELGYTSVVEALAERFHCSPALLKALNPNRAFEAGASIQVPNVEPLIRPVDQPPITAEAARQNKATPKATGTSGRENGKTVSDIMSRPDVVVTVRESSSDLVVKDPTGRVVMTAPVTTGSERDPLPIGEWKVSGIQFNPKFRYNPDLFWDADPSHSKATLAPGPNNPVGLVWIDLSKEHYGIHGTPEPAAIGKTESHGCVRLTNWDAIKLAGLVKPGTRVVFER
jgi:lipoprotein-anchoring transpeptidase ErfK/SrfK